jgi:hemoglobin
MIAVRFPLPALVLLLLLAPAGRAEDRAPPALARPELDRRIVRAVTETVGLGADLYNGGNPEGCYRLYQGSLKVVVALLDHRPALKGLVEEKLRKADGLARPADRAFTLREALDEVYTVLRKDTAQAPRAEKSLWDRLGGESAVRAVVHDFVLAAAPDPKVNITRNGRFPLDGQRVAQLEQKVVEFLSAATGGPLKYTGRDMRTAHRGMAITDAEFDAAAGHLVRVLQKYKVSQKEIDELASLLAGTRNDIVEVKTAAPAKSLYERLGGEAAVKAVVDDFVARAATDPKVNFTRKGTALEWQATPDNVAHLKKALVQLIGAVTGGPQKYQGRSMKEAHRGMKISDAEFNALAADLKASLDKFKVPEKEQGELFTIVESTRKDIVEKAGK